LRPIRASDRRAGVGAGRAAAVLVLAADMPNGSVTNSTSHHNTK
jgi:hypothetical protein